MQEVEFKADVKLSDHNMGTSFEHMDPTFMTYNSGPLWLLILIFVWSLIQHCRGPSEDEGEEEEQLVEGLADYYEALKVADKAALIGQEEYFFKYKVKTFSDESFAKLR